MKTKEIQDIIQLIAKSGIYEFAMEMKGFSIMTKNNNRGSGKNSVGGLETTAIDPDTHQSNKAAEIASLINESTQPEESKSILIKSPMVGTFYRGAGANKTPFVRVGDEIKKGQPLCSIGVMKLFHDVEAEASGTIVKIFCDDASPIEYDTPLFIIDPS